MEGVLLPASSLGGQFWAPDPCVQSIGKRMLSAAPAPFQPGTGLLFLLSIGWEGHPSAMPVRGGSLQVAPTPQPRMQVLSLRPVGPCPCPSHEQPCCGRAGEWSRKGTPQPSEEDEAAAAAAELPPALGRRPACRLSVPSEGVGCRGFFQKCFGTFPVPLPLPPLLPLWAPLSGF